MGSKYVESKHDLSINPQPNIATTTLRLPKKISNIYKIQDTDACFVFKSLSGHVRIKTVKRTN